MDRGSGAPPVGAIGCTGSGREPSGDAAEVSVVSALEARVSDWISVSGRSIMVRSASTGSYSVGSKGAVEALQEFVHNFTYLGVFAVLLLGSLGVPIPEEMPIIAAAVLSHEGVVRWWLAPPVCLLGVLSGDMVLYWVGRHWGEQVLDWRLTRLVLSAAREQWLKAAYRRHALKTVVTARHVTGLRAAAFLTAGSAHVPFWKFAAADAGAALFGVPLLFGWAYFFTDQLEAIMADVHRAERWLGLAGLLALAAMLLVAVWRWHRRVGKGAPG